MNKFEQLIEYVINDEQDKASELFHDIVVEKSRDIYEELMSTDESEAVAEDTEEVVEDTEEVTEDEVTDEELGGHETADLIDDVEADEEGISLEAEELEMDFDDSGDLDAHEEEHADAEELEDRVVDLEDKLDELMAEFEDLVNAEEGEDEGEAEEGEAEAEEEMEESVEESTEEALEEGADLTAAPKPVTSEEGSVNTKGANNDNAGAKGAEAKPNQSEGEEKGRPAPSAKDMGGTTSPSESNAPKAVDSEPSEVNTKSVN